MRFSIDRRSYWLIPVGIVIVLLVAVTTLHLGTRISQAADRALYRQTGEVVRAERDFAMAHSGQYTQSMLDLATAYPKLAFLVHGNSSPVVEFTRDAGGHGYSMELANQSTGGAAAFWVLISDNDTAVLTCSGPGPLCSNRKFALPMRDYALGTESQRRLYDQAITLLTTERDDAAANGGAYPLYTQDLAMANRSLAWMIGPNNPIAQFFTDSSDRGYYAELTNAGSGGSDVFSVLVPDRGLPVLKCVGAAPLCSHGTFKVPAGTFRLSTTRAGK